MWNVAVAFCYFHQKPTAEVFVWKAGRGRFQEVRGKVSSATIKTSNGHWTVLFFKVSPLRSFNGPLYLTQFPSLALFLLKFFLIEA